MYDAVSDRIYEVYKNGTNIVYLKLIDKRLMYDGIRMIPKGSADYYRYPNMVVPNDMMEEIIKYEEKAGIYREQR